MLSFLLVFRVTWNTYCIFLKKFDFRPMLHLCTSELCYWSFHFVLWLTEDSALNIERTWQNFLSNSKTFTLHVKPTPNIFSNVQHYWWQPPSSAQFLIYDTKGKSNTFPVKLKTFAFSLVVFWLFIFFSRYYWINLGFGKLPTYPSPKPSFCPKWEVSDNFRLWEG